MASVKALSGFNNEDNPLFRANDPARAAGNSVTFGHAPRSNASPKS